MHWFQGNGGFDEIAANAPVRCLWKKEQPAGGYRIDPTTGSDAAIVLRFTLGPQVSVSESGGTKNKKMR